jgi:hypothetical protein
MQIRCQTEDFSNRNNRNEKSPLIRNHPLNSVLFLSRLRVSLRENFPDRLLLLHNHRSPMRRLALYVPAGNLTRGGVGAGLRDLRSGGNRARPPAKRLNTAEHKPEHQEENPPHRFAWHT